MDLPKRRITRRELVTDNFHGTTVADPYRWLETDTDAEVQTWIDEQNADFEQYVGGFSARKQLNDRLKELWHYTKCGVPRYVAGKYYIWRQEGLQNQSVLYRLQNLQDTVGEVILDPNLLSEDGTVAVITQQFSQNGKYFAYGLSTAGSDWRVIHVMDLTTGETLPDTIEHVKFSQISWLPDESGFIYTRYPEQDGAVLEKKTLNAMVYLHMVGQPQSEDKLIHKDDAHPEWSFNVFVDDTEKWVFMSTWYNTMPINQLHYKPLDKLTDEKSPWVTIADNFDEEYDVVGVIDGFVYMSTHEKAPFGKIISRKLGETAVGEVQIIIPDSGKMLKWATVVNGYIMCGFLQDAVDNVHIYDKNGAMVKEITLPAPGTVTGYSGKHDREEFFLQFTSYLYPSAVFRYDFSGDDGSCWFEPKIDFPFDDYETVQEFYHSKDGTKIPMFITKAKKLQKDGNNPVLLYGYGGFMISMTPGFSVQSLAWLEKGGVYAVACLRGGSEYGEDWHRAGILEKKQNVFDDFIAAGEYLIEQKYTATKKLAIMGGSNGGLLTATCLTQRPELFGAVVVAVPVVDMLRYHLFTAGRLWTGEYGNAENAEHFPFMYKYSPLHNVKMNVVYPPTLIMTADTDDRVVPGQARKFAATLQAADGGNNPLLIRIEKSAGHGYGKPVSKFIDERADLYTFLLASLGEV
ncbi:MAG: prolyl oligopeptidase family serine peptidase [Defluviitaleaceae bacterium]|nr:prolyl oligopeptidase family serine peptidase [Defluviitaleaceae bacterium]